jgi:hypothetical protein
MSSKKKPHIHTMSDTSNYTLNQLSEFNKDIFLSEGKEEEYKGITIITHREGNEASPEVGDIVHLKYNKINGDTGKMEVEGYYPEKRVFQFILGAGEVLEQWDLVFHKLASGGIYSIFIPSDISPVEYSLLYQLEILRISRLPDGLNDRIDELKKNSFDSDSNTTKPIKKNTLNNRDEYLKEQFTKMRKHFDERMRKKQ